MSGIANVRPLPCSCGGFWPHSHAEGCTNAAMAKLWPKAYQQELTPKGEVLPVSPPQPEGDV